MSVLQKYMRNRFHSAPPAQREHATELPAARPARPYLIIYTPAGGRPALPLCAAAQRPAADFSRQNRPGEAAAARMGWPNGPFSRAIRAVLHRRTGRLEPQNSRPRNALAASALRHSGRAVTKHDKTAGGPRPALWRRTGAAGQKF